MTRTISAIAHEIRNDWKKPYFGAVPYLRAKRRKCGIALSKQCHHMARRCCTSGEGGIKRLVQGAKQWMTLIS